MTKFRTLFLICSLIIQTLASEPLPFSINTKKWSHVLDDHFISITVNPTDLLQGKVYGLAMNSTMAILKGLAPAYVRIGSADTAKYTFKKNRYPSDMIKPEDEYTVTESHWMGFNEVAKLAGLDVIVCLNAAHRVEGTKKWDTRNSLELISFSDSQGYNLTWQLGYEVQGGDDLSGLQFGRDLNRLRTILNAFPRYQHSKLIGPDIRVVHKKEDIDFWNDVLVEAGPTLDAVTWHPRWPQPSKMKVSDNSDLGYEFPIDYLEWDKSQLNKILQKSIFKNPVWIGETKTESTGTFAEGLIWARRLVLAAKLGVEVVMKQPNLMDISHPKPEYWVAILHKRLLGKSVLDVKNMANNTDLFVISHCTNPLYWSDKPEKLQDGPVTVYGVNMGGLEQKIQIKGTWTGKSQLLFQYILTSGSDPDSVFSQMTYLNGEPLMMTDDGNLPDIIPKIKKLERGLTMKLPPYSIGFWVVPEAKVKICQVQPHSIPTINIETLTPSAAKQVPNLQNIRDINQFLVEKLTNPESESEETKEVKIEVVSSESSEKDIPLTPKENNMPRVARRIRQVKPIDELNHELRTIMQETEEFLTKPDAIKNFNLKAEHPKATPHMENRIQSLAEGISEAIKKTNQEYEFNKFLEDSGLKKDFGSLLINDRRNNAPGMKTYQPQFNPIHEISKQRLRRSISTSEESSLEESVEDDKEQKPLTLDAKIVLVKNEQEKNKKQDLVIPHQPDLKGLEERYKFIVHSKIQDNKRKIDDIKKKIKLDEAEVSHKIKQPETVNDIQEEIIKKEIELLEKTEETVADILNSQKKRQETFQDIIFDELNDVKGERITALKEMHRNQKKKDNKIVKRQVQTPLSKPLLKTVEYIEKNFSLEPDSVRKIKRSLEERMGEILKNYDTKKSYETKKRLAPQKEERKISLKKAPRIEEKVKEDIEDDEHKQDEKVETRERPKDKNLIRKISSSSKTHHSSKSTRKQESVNKESFSKLRNTDDNKKNYEDDDKDSFELFNEKKFEEPPKVKKTEKKRSSSDTKHVRKDTKVTHREEPIETAKTHSETKQEIKEEKEHEKEKSIEKEKSEEVVNEDKKSVSDKTPLKNDKERRENMLKQITSMVDHMNSMEKNGERSKRMQEDEEISEEFEPERKIKRRPRKAEMEEIEPELNLQQLGQKVEGVTTTTTLSPPVTAATSTTAAKPTEAPVTPTTTTTQPGRTGRHRKNRVRPNRKLRDQKKNVNADVKEEKETPQMKRHLAGPFADRPLIDLEKKKILKPKVKKFFPKFLKNGNELPGTEKDENLPGSASNTIEDFMKTPEQVKDQQTVQVLPPQMEERNEEILKDLERIKEEKVFLGKSSESSREKLEKSGKDSSEKKIIEMDFSGETPVPTEGYIVVEPTIDTDTEEEFTTEKAEKLMVEIPHQKKDSSDETEEEKKSEKRSNSDEQTNMKMEKEKDEIVKNDQMVKEEDKNDKDTESVKEESSENDESAKPMKKKEIEDVQMKNEKESVPLNKEDDEIKQNDEIEEDEKKEKVQMKNEENEKSEEEQMVEKNVGKNESTQKKSEEDDVSSQMANVFSEEKREEKSEIQTVLEALAEETLPSESKESTEKKEAKDLGREKVLKNDEVPDSKKADNKQRKRRATFLTNRGEEDEEEDYSSEERIQKFKQMVYKKSSAKKLMKNEVRPSGGMGMGADEFLRMAGSTVRVMFDDVIPEAYGQTKTKIQNMGIPQYIKEFGKIVQQMKNLDQVFLNIGEAAVKGYIKGNRAEKGPYIQVISRKKRNVRDENMTDLSSREVESTEEPTLDEFNETTMAKDITTEWTEPMLLTTDPSIDEITPAAPSEIKGTKGSTKGIEYARTSTSETWVPNKPVDNRSGSESGKNSYKDVWENTDGKGWTSWSSQKMEPTQKKTKTSQNVLSKETIKTLKDHPFYTESDIQAVTHSTKNIDNEISKSTKKTEHEIKKQNSGLSHEVSIEKEMKKMSQNLTTIEDLKGAILPWIKTTKDFIKQALTTLQRQRQLSEILARESINREANIKAVEKRDVGSETSLPVHHMVPPEPIRKRETQQRYSDETLIRHLRGLQPGVYVVPTEEMTNIRSEQITNEAKKKPGMPNVVTLNIYYDKKNSEATPKAEPPVKEPEVTQDVVSYYQNKAWNSAASQYDQNNQFVSPIGVPAVGLANPMVAPLPVASPLQTNPVYAVEPRVAEIPNPRLIQYQTPSFNYPPVPKLYPSIVPNPQSAYAPVYYLPQETRFVPQSPGTKRQWREFKARVPASNVNTGWNIQFDPIPGTIKSSVKPLSASSYNKHFKQLFSEKKRSVGDFKVDPTWSESALPFWKFFVMSPSKNSEQATESQEKQDNGSIENESFEDVFVENRKRANQEENKNKKNSVKVEAEAETKAEAETAAEEETGTEMETKTETETETETEAETNQDEKKEKTEKSRKRRSLEYNAKNDLDTESKGRILIKRSYPYQIDFRDQDIIPEWFGTYQEIDNSLHQLPSNDRHSQIVSTPWSDEAEQLLSILEADDELSLVDLDNDEYYYSNDNTIGHVKRYPRSTDQFDSNMIKSNMIYKMPMDTEHVKPKLLGMTGIKKLQDEDSSLELVTKSQTMIEKTTPSELAQTQAKLQFQQLQNQLQQLQMQPRPIQINEQYQPQIPMQLPQLKQLTTQAMLNRDQMPQNGTTMFPRNPNDDTFFYFFKYAYDSLVKVMKSMTEYFN